MGKGECGGGGGVVDRLAVALRSTTDGDLLVVNDRLASDGEEIDPYYLWDIPSMSLSEGSISLDDGERSGDGSTTAAVDAPDALSADVTTLCHAAETALAGLGQQRRDLLKQIPEKWQKLWRWAFAPVPKKDGSRTQYFCGEPPEEVVTNWRLWTVYEEPHFGPGPAVQTLVMTGIVSKRYISVNSQDRRWIDRNEAVWWSVSGDANMPRIGPLALHLILMSQPSVMGFLKERVAPGICAMEYPPGFLVVPMRSGAEQPFSSTNLIVFDPPRENSVRKIHERYLAKDAVGVPPVSPMERSQSNNGVLSEVNGDCLVVDPGAMPGVAQQQLATIINALEGQLLVFLTHHHRDHVEGLSIIEQVKPEALVLGHRKTLNRIRNVGTKLVRHFVGQGTSITIRNETLLVVPAAGHTDGHLALFHVPTRALVAGDHCTGEGNILLDDRSGGDMEDYMLTTLRFMDLRARVLISMHGRPSFCPGVTLRKYKRNPLDRESKISSAIKKGANTVYAIVADAYNDTPVLRWPSEGRNVLLHVRRLHKKGSLPEGFCMHTFLKSTGWLFDVRFLPTVAIDVAQRWAPVAVREHSTAISVSAFAIGILAVCWVKRSRSVF